MNSTTNPVIAAVASLSGEMLALEPQSPHTSGMTIASIRRLIADDSHACTFKSFGQYRTALLKAIDRAMPHSPSSSSSSEAERDAFAQAAMSLIGQIEHLAAGRPANDLMWRDLLARCDTLRTALATPPSLPIDFKQASEQGGWRMVPEGKPTEAMVAAGMKRMFEEKRYSAPWDDVIALMFMDMVKAAPTLQGVADGDAVGGKSGGASND